METIEKKQAYVYDAEELNNKIKEFLLDVNKFIIEKNYTLSNKSKQALKDYEVIDWKSYIGNQSKNMRKRLNKYLSRYKKKRNLHSANLFFHFLYTRILSKREIQYQRYLMFKAPDWVDKVVIKPSLKEQAIQARRKEWLIAKNTALEALNAYKEEKGDFYK